MTQKNTGVNGQAVYTKKHIWSADIELQKIYDEGIRGGTDDRAYNKDKIGKITNIFNQFTNLST
jgi:hypothetical protein